MTDHTRYNAATGYHPHPPTYHHSALPHYYPPPPLIGGPPPHHLESPGHHYPSSRGGAVRDYVGTSRHHHHHHSQVSHHSTIDHDEHSRYIMTHPYFMRLVSSVELRLVWTSVSLGRLHTVSCLDTYWFGFLDSVLLWFVEPVALPHRLRRAVAAVFTTSTPTASAGRPWASRRSCLGRRRHTGRPTPPSPHAPSHHNFSKELP